VSLHTKALVLRKSCASGWHAEGKQLIFVCVCMRVHVCVCVPVPVPVLVPVPVCVCVCVLEVLRHSRGGRENQDQDQQHSLSHTHTRQHQKFKCPACDIQHLRCVCVGGGWGMCGVGREGEVELVASSETTECFLDYN